MTKDPAFLFYYQDFAYGTRKMTFEEKGAYIELLCEQADIGHLSLEDIKRALKDKFPIWELIREKFLADDQGRFYNNKLEDCIEKRKTYVESRKNNLKLYLKKAHMSTHKSSLMENRNRIRINKELKASKAFIKPTVEQIAEYCKEIKSTIKPQEFFDSNEAKGWVVGTTKTPMKDWKAALRTWQHRQPKVAVAQKLTHYETNPQQQEIVSKMISETAQKLGIKK